MNKWITAERVAEILGINRHSVHGMANYRMIESKLERQPDSRGYVRNMRLYNEDQIKDLKASGYDGKTEKSKRASQRKAEGHPWARYNTQGRRPKLTKEEHEKAIERATINMEKGIRVEDKTIDFDPTWVLAWDEDHKAGDQ